MPSRRTSYDDWAPISQGNYYGNDYGYGYSEPSYDSYDYDYEGPSYSQPAYDYSDLRDYGDARSQHYPTYSGFKNASRRAAYNEWNSTPRW